MRYFQKIMRQDKERFVVPKSVQQTIPIQRIWQDGLFYTGNKYSKSWQFTDINYALSSDEDKKAKFETYSALLNAQKSGSGVKITLCNRPLDREGFAATVLLPPQEDNCTLYRDEYNQFLSEQAIGVDAIMQERYITISGHYKTPEDARLGLARTNVDVTSQLARLGSRCEGLDAGKRLETIRGFFRPDEPGVGFDLRDAMWHGHGFRDYVCPMSLAVKGSYFEMDDKFGRVLFLREYANFVSDEMIMELMSLPRSMMLSIDFIPVPTDEAVKEIQTKLLGVETNIAQWQRKQNQANNFSSVIPYDMELQRQETTEFLNDISARDQCMMFALVTIVHLANSKAELDRDTEALQAKAASRMCRLGILRYQQLPGLQTALPFGVRRINALRTLTTEALAVLTPFKSREIMEPGGFYLGNNQTTGNPILLDRALLQNPNLFLLGIPGSGKSMILKQIVIAMALGTKDDIILCDPEGEASAIVRALGGEVIRISVGSDTHINAMDLTEGYSEGNKPWLEKSEFVLSLLEQLDKRGFGLQEKSLIDRCLDLAYEDYLAGAPMPTLCELRQKLLEQPEKEAEGLALAFERFTNGSLNVFSQPTNVKVKSRIISYDISGLGAQLRTIGTLVVSDAMSNRVADNWRNGKRTHILIDEFHVMLENPHGAEFFNSAWRRYRKRNGFPVAATQNVEALLATVQGSTMISNSECVVMLNQAPRDAEKLTELFHISESQQNYIINVPAGSGLLRYGGALVPFMNRFKTDTELYKLITTKPGE